MQSCSAKAFELLQGLATATWTSRHCSAASTCCRLASCRKHAVLLAGRVVRSPTFPLTCRTQDFHALLLLQNHYPERLAQLWFLNAPGIFWGLWKMVSPFIDAGTRDKISFVKGEEALADLKKVIPPEVGTMSVTSPASAVPSGCQAGAMSYLVDTTGRHASLVDRRDTKRHVLPARKAHDFWLSRTP